MMKLVRCGKWSLLSNKLRTKLDEISGVRAPVNYRVGENAVNFDNITVPVNLFASLS